MKRFLLLVAFWAPTVFSIDHNVFKNCSRIPFCAKFRNQVLDEASQFSADIINVQRQGSVATVPLKNSNGESLDLQISLLTTRRVRIKILEKNHSRYELIDVLDKPPTLWNLATYFSNGDLYITAIEDRNLYIVVTRDAPFSVKFYYDGVLEIILKADRLVIENTESSKAFSFGVEFIGASTLYGLYHHAYQLSLGETADGSSDPFRLRNSDANHYEVKSTMALYGSVPVIYGHSAEKTSGIFLHNAAEQWVDISYKGSNPSAYFMVESGTFDLFAFLGPTPADVVRQFTNLTGVAHLPQLWTLGYHQSRYSYKSQEDVKEVVANMDKFDFPMDAIWLDIDYTDGKKYFTWNPDTFSDPIEMQKNLSSTNRKLVTIIDPHIKVDDNYNVYVGAKEKYFVKWADGKNFEGQCWPGLSSYIDFLNPDARDYYASWYSYEHFEKSTETLAGIWNDMNEPSVFDESHEITMPFETVHHGGTLHRDIHNIYGLLHTKATHQGLLKRDNYKKRPFVLTRSHFAGSQRYAAMWTGDNISDWPYLAISYSECMIANILGMVFCGADVGGFFGDPEEQLLQRWYQAAIWLPFFRSHSEINTARREPYLFSNDVQKTIRNSIKLRYKHIPQWYTLFYEHVRLGDPVIRPLFYDYPDVFGKDDHLLVGSDILARPILEANVTSITVFFPGSETNWYRVDDGSWSLHKGNSSESVAVDINTSPYYYRAGSIIVRKDDDSSSTAEMYDDKTPYSFYVNLDAENSAQGRFYLDDFTSFNYTEGIFYYALLTYTPGSTAINVRTLGGSPEGFTIFVRSIVVHRFTNETKKSTETVYTTTHDGTPLETINILEQLNSQRNGELILRL